MAWKGPKKLVTPGQLTLGTHKSLRAALLKKQRIGVQEVPVPPRQKKTSVCAELAVSFMGRNTRSLRPNL